MDKATRTRAKTDEGSHAAVKFGRDPARINLVHTPAEPSLFIVCGAIQAVHLAGIAPQAVTSIILEDPEALYWQAGALFLNSPPTTTGGRSGS